MSEHCIIIGGGHGGAQLCASLKEQVYGGEITLISRDDKIPYHRPPLSKAYLKDPTVDTQIIRPQAFYDDNGIHLLLGQSVVQIDPEAYIVELENGEKLSYSKLVLSTGTLARRLDVPGVDAKGVHYLRVAEDAKALRSEIVVATNVTVIGGGFIGLEAAATFAKLNKNVTVFEAGERLLGRAVSPEVSTYFLEKFRKLGIDIRLDATVSEIMAAKGRVSAVVSDGEALPAEIVLIGIGVTSNCELAKLAGLACNNGIEVDEHMQTSDPDILAIGDCVTYRHWQTGTSTRLESVQNANDQARNAALTLVDRPQPYREVAWFWSDQGDDKLQIVGLSHGSDQRIVRRNTEKNQMSVFHFKLSKLISIETINCPADHMIGRKLLKLGLSPKQSDLESPDFSLRSIL
jgi:3-phenylpropionate/trans-cinnamate dioxygenase ferredoxin reductase subunit